MPKSRHRSAARGLDPALVARARGGDRLAIELVLQRLRPVFKRFYRSKLGPRAVVDDLIQCALLRVHSGLSRLEQPDRLKGFAMKAAVFELHDYYRGRHSAKERLHDPVTLPEDGRVTNPQAGSVIDAERALAALSERARRIIELREYGYKYQEIASMLDTTEAAVKMQVKRGLDRMRQALKE